MRLMFTVCFALLFPALLACSKADSNQKSSTSADLKLATIDNACLNLESIVKQMNSSGFTFQGNVYTRDFEVIGPIFNIPFADSLYANSWRNERRKMDGLPDLKGLQQEGCNRITLPDFDGIRVPYKIDEYSANRLGLQFDRIAYAEALKDLPDVQRDSVLDFPGVKRLIFNVTNPNQIEITSYYTSAPMICLGDRSYEVREQIVYRWHGHVLTAASLGEAMVLSTYWQRLNAVVPSDHTSTEAPGDLVSISDGRSDTLTAALKARTYAICN